MKSKVLTFMELDKLAENIARILKNGDTLALIGDL